MGLESACCGKGADQLLTKSLVLKKEASPGIEGVGRN